MRKRTHNRGRVVTGSSRPSNYRRPKSQEIKLVLEEEGWCWIYFRNRVEVARSPRHWKLIAAAQRTAQTFRDLLVEGDFVAINPPADHKYSGD